MVVRNREAVAAVNGEADAIREVFALSVASASDMTVIHRALVEYLHTVLADEWPALGEERVSERTAMALAELLHRVSDPAIARDAGQAVHTALLSLVMQISALRSQRLALAADGSSTLKWGIVLLLGVVTQVALGLVHLDRPRPQLAAVALFSVASVVALGLIAMQEWPFSGVVQISAAPMHDALKVISASYLVGLARLDAGERAGAVPMRQPEALFGGSASAGRCATASLARKPACNANSTETAPKSGAT